MNGFGELVSLTENGILYIIVVSHWMCRVNLLWKIFIFVLSLNPFKKALKFHQVGFFFDHLMITYFIWNVHLPDGIRFASI